MLLTSRLVTVGLILVFGAFNLGMALFQNLNHRLPTAEFLFELKASSLWDELLSRIANITECQGIQNPDEKPPTISLTLEPYIISGFSETMMACGLVGVLYISLLAFRIHIVKAKAAQHNQVAIIEFAVRNGEEVMAERSYLIVELLAELAKKDDHISKEIARLGAKAAAEEEDKIRAILLQHEALKQRDEAMGKLREIEERIEKVTRDWQWEIGLLNKMNWQKVEELREVKKELGLLEKQIRNGEEENEFVEKERDQARKGESKLAEELKKLRKENEGLVKESTSLKREANVLRDEVEKEEEEASRSRRERRILEAQRDEANREARKVNQELDRLKKEITEGEMKSAEESEAKDKKIFELQQNKAEREEENRKDGDKLMEEKKLQEKESEAKDKQISDLQQKTTDLNAELKATRKHVLKLRQQMEQKYEAKMAREQNWEEYRQFWGVSATLYADSPPIAGTSPAPRNIPRVLLSPRIHMPARPQTCSLAQKVQIGVIQSASVITRSKPTGSPRTTTENASIVASSVAVPPSAPPHPISDGPSTPLASDPISNCTTQTQYLSLELSKQIPRVRIPPPATTKAPPPSDNGMIRQYPSSDSDVIIPNNMPRTSTPRSLGGKYQNKPSTYPPGTSSSTSIPTTAGPFPAQRSISKNPKIAVIQLQITIRLPQTGEVTTDRTPKPLAVLRPRPPPGTPRGPAQPLRFPAALGDRTTRGPGSIYRKVGDGSVVEEGVR